MNDRELACFLSFENEEFVFPAVHHAFKFALISIARSGDVTAADLIFFARHVSELADPLRHFSLTPSDFKTLNPNTRTCPTFRSKRDAELNLAIHRRTGVFVRDAGVDDGNPWKVQMRTRLWHMAEDADYFRGKGELFQSGYSLKGNRFERSGQTMLPLFEAKMVHQFDHRLGTYEGQTEAQANQGKLPTLTDAEHLDPEKHPLPQYWVPAADVEDRLCDCWSRGYLLGWRNIARSTDQRTIIACLLPRVAVGNATPLMFPDVEPALVAALYSNLCSFVLDYGARQKVGGTNVTCNYVNQFPVLQPAVYRQPAPWCSGLNVSTWLCARVLELTYTAWDLEPFAHDVGYDGPPFRWDPERRFLLRCELDAAFFHLYGISRDDAAYVLDTFPIVKRNDEKTHGEYRTQRVILEIYDAMADAARTGKPYQTRLDPPPADARVAHPDTRKAPVQGKTQGRA